jgi:sodium/proline symporter
MILGAVTVLVWKQLEGGIFDIYEILPGFILCALGIFIVSLLDKEPAEEVVSIFDQEPGRHVGQEYEKV